MTETNAPDWELELRVFNCAAHGKGVKTTASKSQIQAVMRELWSAYCDMEVRAVQAEEALEERTEACAKVCEREAASWPTFRVVAIRCAAAIRSLQEQKQ